MKTLAHIILNAARVHEGSYIPGKEADGTQGRYHVDIEQAAKKAAEDEGEPGLAYPVFLLLYATWNDALAWAEENKGA